MMDGVLGEVELASLPERAGKDGLASGTKCCAPRPGWWSLVTNSTPRGAPRASRAGRDRRGTFSNGPPPQRESDGDAQNAAPALSVDADGREERGIANDRCTASLADPHLLVAGV